MTQIEEYLLKAVELHSSDLHISVAVPPVVRVNGELTPLKGIAPLTPAQTQAIAFSLMNGAQAAAVKTAGQTDFSYVIPGVGRFRVNVYKQRKSYSVAIRLLISQIPTIDGLNLPPVLKELALRPRGLVLVTGPTGSGKSTTLAAMVDYINNNKRCHILTIEDPIEYLHRHGGCIVNQREVGDDTESFADALRAALREDPDVILLGEMMDLQTISTAVSAAETGHLVLAELHIVGAAQTIDRIIDMFPPYQQTQIRVQLASVLQAIITQQLIPTADGQGRAAAMEILVANDAVCNMIRENKCHQLMTAMQTGIRQGMMPMDYHLASLVKAGAISQLDALAHSMDAEILKKYLNF